jgi:hypothetical protein
MGPCGVPRRALAESDADADGAGVCLWGMLALVRLPTTPAAHCSPEPDPLVLELCAGSSPLAWDSPMLEELVASLVMS